jgi:hypothetical protein
MWHAASSSNAALAASAADENVRLDVLALHAAGRVFGRFNTSI